MCLVCVIVYCSEHKVNWIVCIMSVNKIRLTLELSNEQRQDIVQYIKDRGWNLDDIITCEEEVSSQVDSSKYKFFIFKLYNINITVIMLYLRNKF